MRSAGAGDNPRRCTASRPTSFSWICSSPFLSVDLGVFVRGATIWVSRMDLVCPRFHCTDLPVFPLHWFGFLLAFIFASLFCCSSIGSLLLLRFGLTCHGTIWLRCGHHHGINGAATLVQFMWLRFTLLLI